MEQSQTNFLTIVNDCIEEAGDDLASFAVDGSDFIVNSDPMMNRFKKWVVRAWRDIQQESLDWEWMSSQAVVNIKPGIMFYSPIPFEWTVDDANPLIIREVDGSEYWSGLLATEMYNLTGKLTLKQNFGYVNVKYSDYSYQNQHTLDKGLKAGGNYFLTSAETGFSVQLSVFEQTIPAESNVVIYGIRFLNEEDGSETSFTLTNSTLGTVANTENSGVAIINLDHDQYDDIIIAMSYTDGHEVLTQVQLTDGGNWTTLAEGKSNPDEVSELPWYVFETLTAAGTTLQLSGELSFTGIPSVGDNITQIEIFSRDALDNATTQDFANTGTIITLHDQGGVTQNDNIVIGVSDPATKAYLDMLLLGDYTQVGITLRKVANSTNTVRGDLVGDPFNSEDCEAIWTDAEAIELKNYVHSWKSFDFSEEGDDDDFVEDIREINQATFRIIYHDDPTVAGELPLTFIPWEAFQNKFDFASAAPSTPRLISEDNEGRYRFYPPLNRPYTILFDYVREPQIFDSSSDVPKGLPQEFIDLIMWRAIAYYGEYDEQPSVVNRAWKNYKTMLMKFEMQTREKFHFKSAYPWGGRTYGI